MSEQSPIKQKITDRLQDLPAEQVKQAMLQWLDEEENSLKTLQNTLDAEEITYGAIDDDGNFTPLTEEDMIQESLEALEDYQNGGDRFSYQSVADLLGSIDSRIEPNKTTSPKTAFEEAVIAKLEDQGIHLS